MVVLIPTIQFSKSLDCGLEVES
uniref:Uncharacterized protein n=1 Tax=Rhizophora mucronata TaxID=61149 RepID=A0A2P2JT61_RHIMU